MSFYLPKLYLLVSITNIFLLPGLILSEFHSNTEYVDSFVDSNNLLHPNLFENIEDNSIMTDNDVISRQRQQPNEDRISHLNRYDKYRNNYKNDNHHQQEQYEQHGNQMASRNLLRKLTENLLKQQSVDRQHSSSSSSSSSSAFFYPLSRSSFYKAYRSKRDDLGWKRSIPFSVK
ncbi:unnamed protein product [Heterobilharzia americana]|nr:unnamed protein product [Heterobilharzia americana]